MCCLAKKLAENMETSSAGALLFVTFNKRLLVRVRRLCQRSMSFVRSCLLIDSYLIRFVANYAVVHVIMLYELIINDSVLQTSDVIAIIHYVCKS